jgi:sucrose-6F-phosphate phosphohydrolase
MRTNSDDGKNSTIPVHSHEDLSQARLPSQKVITFSDLDGTLLWNGKEPYDNSLPIFEQAITNGNIRPIYATGRNLTEAMEGISKFAVPQPDSLIAQVGTRLYLRNSGKYTEDKEFPEQIVAAAKTWSINAIKQILSAHPQLELQPEIYQNEIKLSYYIRNHSPREVAQVAEQLRTLLHNQCPAAQVIDSYDRNANLGLIDILPKRASKLGAMDYLCNKQGYPPDNSIYAGDSGNDIAPLSSGRYAGIVVRNASKSFKEKVMSLAKAGGFVGKIFIANSKRGKLNGNYVSGIIQGLIHFGVLPKSIAEKN